MWCGKEGLLYDNVGGVMESSIETGRALFGEAQLVAYALEMRTPSALWLAHKSVGATSVSLVDALRAEHAGDSRLRVSHGGALDPFAEGLVVLLVGAANRLFERLHDAPKVYRATLRWGAETDTGDGGGVITFEGATGELTPEALEAALVPFLGWTQQVPPSTSNKRVDGERAYVRAHRGEVFELPASRVYAQSLRWLAHDLPRQSELELVVRGGYYVRSIARDLGRALGAGAHLTGLVRTAIGPYRDPGPGTRTQLRGSDVLPWLPTIQLDDAAWGAVRRGGELPDTRRRPPRWPLPKGFPVPPSLRVEHLGRLVALEHGGQLVTLPGGI